MDSGEKKTNKHKQLEVFAGLSRKWVGVKLFMCFPFSWGKRETHKQNSQEISGKGQESPGIVPGQSRENLVYVFACLLVFFPALWTPGKMRSFCRKKPCPKKFFVLGGGGSADFIFMGARIFLTLCRTPEILGKGESAQKSKENHKTKKARKSKKARIGGSG